MDQLTDQQLAAYKDAFSHMEKNAEGVITAQELGKMMRSVGLSPSDDELLQLISASDADNKGEIDFQEYCTIMIQYDRDIKFQLIQAFQMFDKNGDGFVSTDELRLIMKHLQPTPKDVVIKRIINVCENNGDGRISCSEFVAMMKKSWYA